MNACETAPQVIAEPVSALGPGVKSRPSLRVLSHVSYNGSTGWKKTEEAHPSRGTHRPAMVSHARRWLAFPSSEGEI